MGPRPEADRGGPALADRSLVDTVAVALAARDHRVTRLAASLPDGARWAVAAHVLDFDDLHMESTTHISAVCVPTALATGGGARAYLAGAGVMARLGNALGWPHYSAGWHATCTAGAPASAAGAAVALGLTADQIATAIALAVPGAGGVQRAFGTDAKSLQVGFAVDAGIRAATLAAAGAQADPAALDEWLTLVGGDPARPTCPGPRSPAGWRSRSTRAATRCSARSARWRSWPSGPPGPRCAGSCPHPGGHAGPADPSPAGHRAAGQVQPGVRAAAALLDGYPGFASFTDDAVRRPAARRLAGLVEIKLEPGGTWLLDGELVAELHTASGGVARSASSSRPDRRSGPRPRPAPGEDRRLPGRAAGGSGRADLAERRRPAPGVLLRPHRGRHG